MYFSFYSHMIGVFLYMMITANSRLLHQLHSLSSTPPHLHETKNCIRYYTTFADLTGMIR